MTGTKHPKPSPKENDVEHPVIRAPGKDDVHEQREPDQPVEGVVRTPRANDRPTTIGPTGSGSRSRRSKRGSKT